MELASVLAGAPWSDRPGCTHPVLAAAARSVNDLTTDAGLPRLVPLVPLVVGTDDPDPGHATRLALFCLEWVSDIDSSHRSALDCSWLTAELLLEVAPPAAVEARHTRQARELNVTLVADTGHLRPEGRSQGGGTGLPGDRRDRRGPRRRLAGVPGSPARFRRRQTSPGPGPGFVPNSRLAATAHPTKGGAGVRSQFLLGGGPASNP